MAPVLLMTEADIRFWAAKEEWAEIKGGRSAPDLTGAHQLATILHSSQNLS